jgi:hypothetical protein
MNEELLALYQSDRQEHANQATVNTPEYRAMRARDLLRRERVMEILAQSKSLTAEDFLHAAQVMSHGDTPEDAQHAYRFAVPSSEPGFRPARWRLRATIAG